MDSIKVVIGPLSQSVDALALWMKVVGSQQFYNNQQDPYNKMIDFN